MRLQQVTWLHLLGISLVVLAFLLVSGKVVMAQGEITVRLDPVGESEISGTVILTAAGEGTDIVLYIEGLPPSADARATLHANSCAIPSASFTALPELKADATGRATATGSVLFRGTENVSLATMADGEHIITIQTEQMVACGVIPKLTSVSAPSTLPVTGGPASSRLVITMGVIGLCTFFTGLLLWQRSQPRHRF